MRARSSAALGREIQKSEQGPTWKVSNTSRKTSALSRSLRRVI
jgi:hypothetical protein